MTGRVITSAAKAIEIAEGVCAKHHMPLRTALCAKWDRFAIACRAEIAWELKLQLRWSQRAIGDYLGCTQPNVRKLFSYHEMNLARARLCLPKVDIQALAALSETERDRRLLELEEEAAYMRSEIDRMIGEPTAQKFHDQLGLKMRCAISLAILAEAYPRAVGSDELIERYDEACVRLNVGFQSGVSSNMMCQNFGAIRRHFEERGWPRPEIITDGPRSGTRRLTDPAASWLHERFEVPKLSALARSRSVVEQGVG